jgi:HemK-like putative methylase
MLIEAANEVKQSGGSVAQMRFYGQEVNQTSAAIGRMNLLIHEVEDAQIRREDTLRQPKFTDTKGKLDQFDMVVANPPYIAEGDEEVSASVVAWEPHAALYSGADGLDAIRRIVADAPAWLCAGGWLVMEIGYRQGDAVAALFGAGWESVAVRQDLTGRDRFVVARRLAE